MILLPEVARERCCGNCDGVRASALTALENRNRMESEMGGSRRTQ